MSDVTIYTVTYTVLTTFGFGKVTCIVPVQCKALGKLENICDSRCFLKCFPVCPPVETLLRKQNLLPEKQKCFLANLETFDVSLCFSLMFLVFAHSGKHGETLVRNNVSATMFPSLPRA